MWTMSVCERGCVLAERTTGNLWSLLFSKHSYKVADTPRPSEKQPFEDKGALASPVCFPDIFTATQTAQQNTFSGAFFFTLKCPYSFKIPKLLMVVVANSLVEPCKPSGAGMGLHDHKNTWSHPRGPHPPCPRWGQRIDTDPEPSSVPQQWPHHCRDPAVTSSLQPNIATLKSRCCTAATAFHYIIYDNVNVSLLLKFSGFGVQSSQTLLWQTPVCFFRGWNVCGCGTRWPQGPLGCPEIWLR